METHYLHLVKLGITLKYIKKNEVDSLLEKKEFSILKKHLKKVEWQNIWRIYIENSIANTFVKHGFLDKKLFLVMTDDLILKAKQGKAILGPMIAVQKNLLGQKIVDRAYTNIIAKKVKLPDDVYDSLYKNAFLTGDANLFGFGFEDIEEVEPLNMEERKEIQKKNKQEAKTVFAHKSNDEPTQRINYKAVEEEVDENVCSDDKTTIMYKENIDTTNEICRDLDEDFSPSTNWLFVIFMCISVISVIVAGYLFLLPKGAEQILQDKKLIVSILHEKNWKIAQKKYWKLLALYSKNLQKLPKNQTLLKKQIKCLTSFYDQSLKKHNWYLSNAIKNEHINVLEILLFYGYISKQILKTEKQKIQKKFDVAIAKNTGDR